MSVSPLVRWRVIQMRIFGHITIVVGCFGVGGVCCVCCGCCDGITIYDNTAIVHGKSVGVSYGHVDVDVGVVYSVVTFFIACYYCRACLCCCSLYALL